MAPSPSCRPLAHRPSQQLPFLNIYLPIPWRLPSTYSPQQLSPLAQVNFPWPLNWPSFHSPQYMLPFEQVSLPFPSLWLQQKLPSQMLPLWKEQVPLPNLAPYISSPSNRSPFAYTSLPRPWGNDFAQLPSQVQPESAFQKRPWPSALKPRISPAKQHPLRKTKTPNAGLLFSTTPLNTSLFGKYSITLPLKAVPRVPPRQCTVSRPSDRLTSMRHSSSDSRVTVLPNWLSRYYSPFRTVSKTCSVGSTSSSGTSEMGSAVSNSLGREMHSGSGICVVGLQQAEFCPI